MSQTTATSEFNSNRWYQILLSNETLAFTGTPRWDGYSYGSMMTNVQNRTEFEQQWQVYPFNSTFFVLRTRASGPDNYLRVMLSVDGEGLPIPKPRMVNPMLPDVSWLWAMGKWADGSFYLWNAENGTNWHLNTTVLPSGHTEMVSLNPQPKQGQAFTFKELGEINNQTFSTINIPPSLARATSSTAPGASSPSPTPTSPAGKDSSGASNREVTSSDSGSGLSTGVKAAIGVCATVSVVVIFALMLFWVRRCRRRRQNRAALEVLKVHPQDLVHERAGPMELAADTRPSEVDGVAKYEMDGVVNYEMGGVEKYEMGDGMR
ncbi:hypothetical protein BC567DRAFT_206598 [Phyllosticta citribraziliensis]